MASGYAVRIEHWYQFEHILATEVNRNLVITVYKEIKKTIEDETGWCLPWVDPRANKNHLECTSPLTFVGIRFLHRIRDRAAFTSGLNGL